MQLGFVIDHSRCIGCHACTVACKAENDVPLGSFRTWVKYTERGTFPEVRRSFAVLRCNQCTSAPCVTICPVRALEKRPDGIVDIDPAACIGCKACMQGCPYDALYLNESKGTAEKCHFCAHRTEIGLAPACAVVCPTEAIVPGDFHDPGSAVSRLRREHDLRARKAEAETGPNVLYREVSDAGVDPLATHAAAGYLWSNPMPGLNLDAEAFQEAQQEAEERASARTTYDVDHPSYWGWKVSGYMFTKSLAAGLFLVLPLLYLGRPASAPPDRTTVSALSLAALLFLLVTTVLLVADLKRPARFLYILWRPNWSSWLTRGSLILIAYGAVLSVWSALLLREAPATRAAGGVAGASAATWSAFHGPAGAWLIGSGCLLAALAAGYTGWLFGQARGRVLWMRRGLWLHLIVQALAAGLAFVMLTSRWLELGGDTLDLCRRVLLAALGAHLLLTLTEGWLGPGRRRKEYRRAAGLITRGPFAARHYGLGVAVGVALPAALLWAGPPGTWIVAAALVLLGLWVEEDILVRAGQALPIS